MSLSSELGVDVGAGLELDPDGTMGNVVELSTRLVLFLIQQK